MFFTSDSLNTNKLSHKHDSFTENLTEQTSVNQTNFVYFVANTLTNAVNVHYK